MTTRSNYQRRCKDCGDKLDRHDTLYNDGICTACVEARLAKAKEKPANNPKPMSEEARRLYEE